MSSYFVLTLWVISLLALAYILCKLGMPNDFVTTIMLMGFLAMIYWVLLTTAIIVFGIQKYRELGSMDMFIQEFLRSVHE